jgi:hypothetical protein
VATISTGKSDANLRVFLRVVSRPKARVSGGLFLLNLHLDPFNPESELDELIDDRHDER